MYRTIRLYGSKIINIVRLSSFLRIRTLCVLFIQLIRDFFYFHFKECCFFENQKIDSIRRWMDEHYCDMVPATFPSLQEKSNNDPVWIFWYQGETAMSEIVKICYNSIVSNIHDRPVHLLTKDNIASHVTLPNYIYDRLNRGELSYTHFSDILRICLLFDKGGIWMDSTLLITDSISIPAPDYFHSIKIVTGSNTTISAYRWATFFLASTHGNPAFGTIQSIFLKYLQEYNKMIDYLLIDYIFDLIYRKNDSFRRSVDTMPYTSPYLHQLLSEMNQPYDAEKFDRIKQETTVFKLNHRLSYYETADGKETLYGYLKNKFLNTK